MRPIHSEETLLKIWTEPKIFFCSENGAYSLIILKNLLQKDWRYYKDLMEYEIHRTLKDILDLPDVDKVHCESIDLLIALILAEEHI